MKKISPNQIPFLKTFEHPDLRASLSPINSRDDSWPTRGLGHVQRGRGDRRGSKANHVPLMLQENFK